MTVVEAENLTKIYGNKYLGKTFPALDNVSLSINKGNIFALLGPNGAGKTTLFKILLGILPITSGKAFISGLSPDNPLSRKKTGYLPENPAFPSHLTAAKLLRFTGRLYGLDEALITERSNELLRLVEMEKYADTKIVNFSKGMIQRIGLAQALISDPEILFLDEPTDGIDAIGKVEVKKILKSMKSKGTTIIINSHLLSEVETIADTVCILSRGKVIKISSVDELTTQECQYEIETDAEKSSIEIPPEIGKVSFVAANKLLITLNHAGDINNVIDFLRKNKVKIKTIKPLKVSLEDSFIETIKRSRTATE
tara:strand:- start:2684 stop:3616 length:933 start_codon:yes stop_codon:yes gene_type:complete